jgi:DNA-binding SARP family transcriptional activator
VITRNKVGAAFETLAASLTAAAPRVLVLSAPPGYRKTRLARTYAARVGRFVACEVRAAADGDVSRSIIDALVAGDEARAARSAADRLARRPDATSAADREVLRREWGIAGPPELFTFHDMGGVLATPRGAEALAEVLATCPPGRSIAIVTRTPLPPRLQHSMQRHASMTLGTADLAVPGQDVTERAAALGLAKETGAAVYEIAAGSPLVAELLLWLATHENPNQVIADAASVSTEARLAFAVHRTIVALDENARDALAVTAILRTASHVDLVRVIGERCDDAVFARLSGLGFVDVLDGRASVHPEAVALLFARFAPTVKEQYERALRVLTGDGAYLEAAQVAVDAGEPVRAAAIIDAAPPYTAAPVPIGAYQRVIDRIDRDLITRYPNIWVATIPYRSFAVDPATYIREAETVHYCLPARASRDQRAAVLMLLASAYVNLGRLEDADALVHEALHGFALEPSAARAAILNFEASLRGIEGRFTAARSLASEAARIAPDGFGENQTLHYIDAHEAAYRGKHDRMTVIVDELLRRRRDEALPLYLAYVAASGAIFSWAHGDDASLDRYLTVLEDVITPGLEAGFAPLLDAARGRPLDFRHDEPWPVVTAMAQLYRMGRAESAEEAREAARLAAAAADSRRDPYLQVLAHIALSQLDVNIRTGELTTAARIAALMETPELQAAVAALARSDPALMLESLVSGRIRRDRNTPDTVITVSLLDARVLCGREEIKLTEKEFELLAFLASTRGSVSRDRIGESLWDHLDPEDWRNNFKVTVYRIRSKLRERHAIVADGLGFRLGPAVRVDLLEAETVVREHADRALEDVTRTYLRQIAETFRAAVVAKYERYSWGQALLARMGDVVCRAGMAVAVDLYARDRFDDALAMVARVSEADPFNESAAKLAVSILLARGDRDGARREYQRFTTELAREYGATPSETFAELLRSAQ